MSRSLHLLDWFDRARLHAAGPGHVGVEHITLNGDSRSALFEHPDSSVEFPPIRVGPGARLRFAVGIRQTVWERIRAPVEFSVAVRQGRQRQTLFEHSLNPATVASDRGWHDVEVALTGRSGATVELIFETRVPSGADPAYAWAGWSDPVVEGWLSDPPPARRSSHPLVILITCDALRPDLLGCYGHPHIQTPHLDRLAAEGWRFEQARAPSPATLASHAALGTGLHPAALGIDAEWGEIPRGHLFLLAGFRDAGFETVLAASEMDMQQALAKTGSFDRTIPLLGTPEQDGGITTRRLLEWLGDAPPRRRMIWLQYFDSHPPPRAPRPQVERYSGLTDPELDATSATIHGVETSLEIERALPRLRRGLADAALAARLRATALGLEGRLASPPDLTSHLTALARQDPGNPTFRVGPETLRQQAEALTAGAVPEGLVAWLEALRPHLREIEAEITLGLQGVTSLGQAVRLHWGQVSYLDGHLGTLLSGLQALGLYDQATIAFTSPHGEGFGERGVVFHHHALLEACLRVPLVLKPAADIASAASRPPGPVAGVFSLLDLPATLLAMFGVPTPPQMQSISRWDEISRPAPLAPVDAVALGPYRTQAALVRDDRKLVLGFVDHDISEAWNLRGGESVLLDIGLPDDQQEDLSALEPEQAASMRQRLEAWAEREIGAGGSGPADPAG